MARFCKKPLLVTARAFKPIKRVLIAFDDGKSTRNAVQNVALNPLFHGLDIKLITVGDQSDKVESALMQAAHALGEAGLTVSTDTVPGQPETTINQEIESGGHDLLVMGAHGHSRIRRMILGSTTTSLMASCKISVLLYR